MIKLLLTLALLTSFAFTSSTNKDVYNLSIKYVMDYDKNTSCLVRNFKVYKDPKWVAKIVVRNGKSIYFSSPKSLFEFYHRPGKWFDVGVKSERDFSKIVVTDFITLKPINAETAFYVYGSRATSPAGDDLVAIGSEEEAIKFSKQYHGKRILKFDEVNNALIKLLNGRI